MNCKLGDLAIVIAVVKTPEAIGSIVEIVGNATPGDEFECTDGSRIKFAPASDGAYWVVKKAVGKMPWRTNEGILRFCEFGVFHDSYLRPISGVPVTDDIEDEVTA